MKQAPTNVLNKSQLLARGLCTGLRELALALLSVRFYDGTLLVCCPVSYLKFYKQIHMGKMIFRAHSFHKVPLVLEPKISPKPNFSEPQEAVHEAGVCQGLPLCG